MKPHPALAPEVPSPLAADSATLSASPLRSSTWLEQAIFRLDGWLRRRRGIYEYSSSADCLFRIQPDRAERPFTLRNAERVGAGEPILRLHLWNEHVPPMGRRGPTVAWARRISRRIELSLYELAEYLPRHPELDRVRLLSGEMHLTTPRQREQLAHITARYGFETDTEPRLAGLQALRWAATSVNVLLLMLATNPMAVRAALPLHHRQLLLARATLECRYGTTTARSR